MAGRRNSARAMAERCFWPPESVTPRSPTMVSKPCGNSSNSERMCAASAASKQVVSARVGRAEGEVLADGFAEEKGLLRHHADVAAQHGKRIFADGAAVDEQRSLGRFVEPRRSD